MRYSPQVMKQQEAVIIQALNKADGDVTDDQLKAKVQAQLHTAISMKRIGDIRATWQGSNRKTLRRSAAAGHTATQEPEEAQGAETTEELLGNLGVETRGGVEADSPQALPPDLTDAVSALGDAMDANNVTQLLLTLEGQTVSVTFRRSVQGKARIQRTPPPVTE